MMICLENNMVYKNNNHLDTIAYVVYILSSRWHITLDKILTIQVKFLWSNKNSKEPIRIYHLFNILFSNVCIDIVNLLLVRVPHGPCVHRWRRWTCDTYVFNIRLEQFLVVRINPRKIHKYYWQFSFQLNVNQYYQEFAFKLLLGFCL